MMELLTPTIVDRKAVDTPDALYAEYPRSTTSYEDGYQKIIYRDLANAVNGLAWWLHDTLGPAKESEHLAYIGPNDILYPSLIIGAAKVGYTIFLTSPRNSIQAQISLFDRLQCKVMLTPDPRPPPVTALLAAYELSVVTMPSINELLGKSHEHFPFEMSSSEAWTHPFFTVHTSGSTGIPKPLTFTHGSAVTNTKMMMLDPPPGFWNQEALWRGKRVFLTFPPFHGAFLLFHLFNAIPKGIVMIMPTSGAIPSAEGLVEGLKQAPADVAVIVPSIVHELSQSPELLDYCAKNLEAIFYCGGDLPKSTGDIIASKIKLYNQFGASEIGLTAQIWPNRERDPKDWKYVQFHPALGIELRPVTDEIHELYVVRDPNKKEQQHAFTLFPDTREYRSRDLFVRHPSREKSDLWSWHARADDIIVFLNGEKTNPISMEQHIVSSVPEVAAALVVGAQRFQPALLIEIKRTTNDKELSLNELAAFIEKMWPAIEEANQDAPTHAQIFKSHILFTHPERPMLRAGKGTIQRSGTLQLYASEIDALYADANRLSESEDARSLDIIDDTTVSRFIRETIMSITKFPELGDKENFFTLGMDSLQTLIAVRRLKRGLAIPEIAPSTIYMNSSVTDLTAALLRLLEQHHISEASQKQSRIQEVNSILKEYQESVDQVLMPSKSIAKICEHNVILTGSTGGLGSHILHTLMNAPVAHIYCLNRATDSVSLQEKRNRAYGLPTHADSKRVTFLTSDLSKVNLGLEPSVFNELQSKTTLIIHNAWPVNFNIPLPAFRPQLDGILNLIRFAADAAASPHLFFISSISSVMSYRSDSLKTSEGIVSDVSAPGPNAYAQSKYISEHILNHAAQRLSISSSIARVGQVAGAVSHKGLWNTSEWFPSLVMSSFHLGAMPDDLGYMSVIDWVPIDLLAEVLVELALNADSRENQDLQPQSPTKGRITQTSPRIFHPLNPHSITWDIIYPMIASIFSSSTTRKPLRTVSFSSWIEKVRQDMEATAGSRKELREEELAEALRQNPAAKLLDFYEGLLSGHERTPNRLETRMTEAASGKMRGLERIKGEWIEKWVREWLSELS